jgi:hypothetical protein
MADAPPCTEEAEEDGALPTGVSLEQYTVLHAVVL